MHLLSRIERYLHSTGTRPARFGADVLGDPRFVSDLRNGREPRAVTVRKVSVFLDRIEQAGIAEKESPRSVS